MSTDDRPETVVHSYTMNDGTECVNHTDPTGLWHAGVAATIWDSSLILSKHFEKTIQDAQGESQNCHQITKLLGQGYGNILELGAGCSALPSVVLSRLLCTDQTKFQFFVTDKQTTLPLLRKSIETNKFRHNFEVCALDWQEEIPCHFSDRQWDIVLASDLLAFPDQYDSLNRTLKSLCKTHTLVYIAYERRNFSSEVDFFRDFGKSFQFEMVQKHELDDLWQAPEEIYLYRAWLRS